MSENFVIALEKQDISFETKMTAHIFLKIFAITDPASNILQSEEIDLLFAVRLVEMAEGRLPRKRSDFTKVLAETKKYCSRHNLVREDFPANWPGEGR